MVLGLPLVALLTPALADPRIELPAGYPFALAGHPLVVRITDAGEQAPTWVYGSPDGPGQGICVGLVCYGLAPTADLLLEGIAGPDGVLDGAVVVYEVGEFWLQAGTQAGASSLVVIEVLGEEEDRDGDGLPNGEEWFLGTDPTSADTDGDGVRDDVELAAGTNPRHADTDADGLGDGDELAAGTDPFHVDSEGDGVWDLIEVLRGMDPWSADSDGDGWPDRVDPHATVPDMGDPHVVDDVVISDPADSLPDPEYHPDEHLVTWQERDGAALWLASYDPGTGALDPVDGRGVLIDTDVLPMPVTSNGPEWVDTDLGAEILYAKRGRAGVIEVRRAAQQPGGGPWFHRRVVDGVMPFGTAIPGDPDARVLYRQLGEDGGYQPGIWWTDLLGSLVGHLPDVVLSTPRWTDRGTIVASQAVDGVRRLVEIDPAWGTVREVTPGDGDQLVAFAWSAPDLGGDTLYLTADATLGGTAAWQITVYRSHPQGGVWLYDVIRPPAGLPFVGTPEPFVSHDGRSFVSFTASSRPYSDPEGVGAVYVASVDPMDDLVRRVSDPGVRKVRDPEPVHGTDRTWVMYVEAVDDRRVVHRCELGL